MICKHCNSEKIRYQDQVIELLASAEKDLEKLKQGITVLQQDLRRKLKHHE